MNCNIGNITGNLPETSTGSVVLNSYQHGLNCDLWGPSPSPFPAADCGPLAASGTAHYEYHTTSPTPFADNPLLQKHPTIGCLWRKRSVKIIQGVYHFGGNKLSNTQPPTVLATLNNFHYTNVTAPYVDPIDSGDQWSPVVFPVNDSVCNTVPDANFPDIKWQCYDATVSSLLTLRIQTLSVFNGYGTPTVYDCQIGQTVYDPEGTPHWELEYVVNRASASYSNLSTTGLLPPNSLAGVVSGSVSKYHTTSSSLDPLDPTTGITAKPPYIKIEPESWCHNLGNLYSGYGATCLRWTKEVDCDTDFNGNPIELTLDSPRAFLISGGCFCMDYHVNANSIGVTGYNDTAIVTPIYA